jgi:hypothetical protein
MFCDINQINVGQCSMLRCKTSGKMRNYRGSRLYAFRRDEELGCNCNETGLGHGARRSLQGLDQAWTHPSRTSAALKARGRDEILAEEDFMIGLMDKRGPGWDKGILEWTRSIEDPDSRPGWGQNGQDTDRIQDGSSKMGPALKPHRVPNYPIKPYESHEFCLTRT